MPDRTRAALVLGAAVWPGGQPSPALRRRALHGATLVLAGQAEVLIACGGRGLHPPTEAEAIRDICLDAGVPEEKIRLEDRSGTTRENIAFAIPILESLGRCDVILVTDAYHAPRARLIGRRLGLRCRSDSPPASDAPWHRQLRPRLREGPAYLYYLLWPAALR